MKKTLFIINIECPFFSKVWALFFFGTLPFIVSHRIFLQFLKQGAPRKVIGFLRQTEGSMENRRFFMAERWFIIPLMQ